MYKEDDENQEKERGSGAAENTTLHADSYSPVHDRKQLLTAALSCVEERGDGSKTRKALNKAERTCVCGRGYTGAPSVHEHDVGKGGKSEIENETRKHESEVETREKERRARRKNDGVTRRTKRDRKRHRQLRHRGNIRGTRDRKGRFERKREHEIKPRQKAPDS